MKHFTTAKDVATKKNGGKPIIFDSGQVSHRTRSRFVSEGPRFSVHVKIRRGHQYLLSLCKIHLQRYANWENTPDKLKFSFRFAIPSSSSRTWHHHIWSYDLYTVLFPTEWRGPDGTLRGCQSWRFHATKIIVVFPTNTKTVICKLFSLARFKFPKNDNWICCHTYFNKGSHSSIWHIELTNF